MVATNTSRELLLVQNEEKRSRKDLCQAVPNETPGDIHALHELAREKVAYVRRWVARAQASAKEGNRTLCKLADEAVQEVARVTRDCCGRGPERHPKAPIPAST